MSEYLFCFQLKLNTVSIHIACLLQIAQDYVFLSSPANEDVWYDSDNNDEVNAWTLLHGQSSEHPSIPFLGSDDENDKESDEEQIQDPYDDNWMLIAMVRAELIVQNQKLVIFHTVMICDMDESHDLIQTPSGLISLFT